MFNDEKKFFSLTSRWRCTESNWMKTTTTTTYPSVAARSRQSVAYHSFPSASFWLFWMCFLRCKFTDLFYFPSWFQDSVHRPESETGFGKGAGKCRNTATKWPSRPTVIVQLECVGKSTTRRFLKDGDYFSVGMVASWSTHESRSLIGDPVSNNLGRKLETNGLMNQ